MSKRDFKSLNQDIDKDLLTKLRRKNELKVRLCLELHFLFHTHMN